MRMSGHEMRKSTKENLRNISRAGIFSLSNIKCFVTRRSTLYMPGTGQRRPESGLASRRSAFIWRSASRWIPRPSVTIRWSLFPPRWFTQALRSTLGVAAWRCVFPEGAAVRFPLLEGRVPACSPRRRWRSGTAASLLEHVSLAPLSHRSPLSFAFRSPSIALDRSPNTSVEKPAASRRRRTATRMKALPNYLASSRPAVPPTASLVLGRKPRRVFP